MGVSLGFDLGRSDGFPTRYGDQYSPVTVDVPLAGIITAFIILGVTFLAIIPAYNSILRTILFSRVVCSLVIGGIILGGNYGHHWEKGVIKMSAPYKPGFADEVKGELGLHIALRGINITLIGNPDMKKENTPLANERINYNEHFSWEWAQGRFGFGKYAGRFSREFRAGVIRGLPLPILQVAEYFTFDGEGIRFGRHYRQAGWYTHLILWFAFGSWIITNILFCLVINTASWFLMLTGGLQVCAVGVWTFLRNPIELHIPFQTEDGHHETILMTKYGVDYYLVLGNGVFCIVLGTIIWALDKWKPEEMCQCFGIDKLSIYDPVVLSNEEKKEEKKRMTMLLGNRTNDIEMQDTSMSPSGGASESFNDQHGEVVHRRRSNKASFLRRSLRHIKPRVPRRKDEFAPNEDKRVKRPLLGPDSSDENGGARSIYTSSNDSWPAPPTPLLETAAPPPPPPRPRKF